MTRARELARLANENVFTAEDYNSPVQVGINSTDPTSTLDVRGELKVGTAIQAGTAGVITATEFSGTTGTFSGDVSIGGTLTYEDVTNIDSVGIVTARAGVNVSGGQLLVGSGVTIGIAGVTTFSGTADVHLHDNVRLNVGDSSDLAIYHASGWNYIQGVSNSLAIQAKSGENSITAAADGNVALYFDGSAKFETTKFGTITTGIATVSGDVSIADKIIHTGDTNTAIRFPAADTVTVETAGTERVRVSSAGSFAIGDATEPGAKLYVNGVSSNDIITARAADTNGNSIINIIAEGTQGNSRITFADTAGVDGWVSYNHSSRQVNFAAGGTSPQVHVNRTGELLVGTATTFGSDSARKLQLENDVTGPVIALKTDNNNPNADTFLGGLENISECNGVNTINSAIYFDADGNHSGSNGPGRIELHTNSGNSLLERVRVDSNGYVGIKLSDPHLYYSKDLVVQAISQGGITVRSSNTTDTNYLMFADGTSGNERYRGYIGYAHNTGSDNGEHMQFAASGGTGLMRFYADGLALSGETATANRLNDYEEGDFTPTLGHSHTAAEADGKYTKVGNMCVAAMSITLPTTSNANHMVLGSLPFTAAGGRPGAAILRYSNSGTAYLIAWHVNAGESSIAPYYGNGGSVVTYAEQSGKRFDLTFVYRTA